MVRNSTSRTSTSALLLTTLVVIAACGCGGDERLTRPPTLPGIERLDGDVQREIRRLEHAIAADPDNAGRWFKLGLLYEGHEYYDVARACYRQAALRDDTNARPWFHQGLIAAEEGRMDDASALMSHAAARTDSYAPASWRCGLYRLETGRHDDAEVAFRRATQIDPADPAGWLGLARVALQKGQDEQAAELLERLLETGLDRNRTYAHQLLGTAYRNLGRLEEARAAFALARGGQATWSDPWQSRALNALGTFSARLNLAREAIDAGDVSRAVTMYEDLLKERPEHVIVLSKLGLAYGIQGDVDKSIELLERAVAVDPSAFAPRLTLAYSLARRGGEAETREEAWSFFERSLERADEALARQPKLAKAWGVKGDVYRNMGRGPEAIGAYREAARFDAERSHVWLGQAARIHALLGQYDEAIAILRPILETQPRYAAAWQLMAAAQIERGRLDEARATLEAAQRELPGDAMIEQALADLAARERAVGGGR